MKRLVLVAILSVFAFAYSSKGLSAYKKLCAQCHGPAFKGAAMLYSDEWEEMFANGAKKLKKVHLQNEKAINSIESNYFKRRGKYLKKFLFKNARDFGVVRGCDALNCG